MTCNKKWKKYGKAENVKKRCRIQYRVRYLWFLKTMWTQGDAPFPLRVVVRERLPWSGAPSASSSSPGHPFC